MDSTSQYIRLESFTTSNDDTNVFVNSNIETMRMYDGRVGIGTSNLIEKVSIGWHSIRIFVICTHNKGLGYQFGIAPGPLAGLRCPQRRDELADDRRPELRHGLAPALGHGLGV